MRIEWDPAKNASNQEKHGVSFVDVEELFKSGDDYLEIFDEAHSDQEDRFIAIGPVEVGVLYVVFTERDGDTIRIISARRATKSETDRYHKHMEQQR